MTKSKDSVLFADYTHNFWIGCRKLSDGCKFCYLYREQGSRGIDATNIKRLSDETFYKPKKLAGRNTIFTCSYSDFFISAADDWKVIRATPQHVWIIITKGPWKILYRIPDDWESEYSNVILGITVGRNNLTLEELPADLRVRNYPDKIINNREYSGLFE